MGAPSLLVNILDLSVSTAVHRLKLIMFLIHLITIIIVVYNLSNYLTFFYYVPSFKAGELGWEPTSKECFIHTHRKKVVTLEAGHATQIVVCII